MPWYLLLLLPVLSMFVYSLFVLFESMAHVQGQNNLNIEAGSVLHS